MESCGPNKYTFSKCANSGLPLTSVPLSPSRRLVYRPADNDDDDGGALFRVASDANEIGPRAVKFDLAVLYEQDGMCSSVGLSFSGLSQLVVVSSSPHAAIESAVGTYL